MTITYQRGNTTAAIHDGSVVLVGDTAATGATTRVWDVLSRDRWDPMDVIEVLSCDGLAKTPDFAVAAVRGDRVVVVVRGGCVAQICADGQVHDVDGRQAVTWVEQSFAWNQQTRLVLRAEDTDAPWWPVASGVAFVSAVQLGTAAGTTGSEPPEVERPEVEPADVENREDESTSEPESVPEVVEAPDEPVADDSSAPESESQPAPVAESGTEPQLPDESDELVPADPNATLADVDQSRFDAMFGATIAGRRLEDAAVREDVEAVPPSAPAPSSERASSAPPPPAGAPAPPVLGDHAGDTVSAAELARLRRTAQSEGVPAPPPMPTSPPSITATLHLSTGRTVELGRPCVIGRAPRSHGATSAQLPQTVVIDNPYISGTHVVVAVDDGVVTATDLSTNGTLLTRPGQDPVRLDKGRATIVTDGCVLSLSDDITIRVAITRGGETA